MNEPITVLFVGGPYDAKMLAIPDEIAEHTVLEFDGIDTITTHLYRLDAYRLYRYEGIVKVEKMAR